MEPVLNPRLDSLISSSITFYSIKWKSNNEDKSIMLEPIVIVNLLTFDISLNIQSPR